MSIERSQWAVDKGPPIPRCRSMMSTDPRRSIGKLGGVICGSPGASDLSARMCAKTHFRARALTQGRAEPDRLFFSK